MEITEDTYIEELLQSRPEVQRLLLDEGVRCVCCGEPVWSNLGELLRGHGKNDKDIKRLVKRINEL